MQYSSHTSRVINITDPNLNNLHTSTGIKKNNYYWVSIKQQIKNLCKNEISVHILFIIYFQLSAKAMFVQIQSGKKYVYWYLKSYGHTMQVAETQTLPSICVSLIADQFCHFPMFLVLSAKQQFHILYSYHPANKWLHYGIYPALLNLQMVPKEYFYTWENNIIRQESWSTIIEGVNFFFGHKGRFKSKGNERNRNRLPFQCIKAPLLLFFCGNFWLQPLSKRHVMAVMLQLVNQYITTITTTTTTTKLVVQKKGRHNRFACETNGILSSFGSK